MGRIAARIDLSEAERDYLEGLLRAHSTGQAIVLRAQIVLAAGEGLSSKVIRARLKIAANTVGKWRSRFSASRLDGLYDEPRSGTPRQIGDDEIADLIKMTLETTPKGATHWSLRSMASSVGHAPSTIHRIWKAFGLQPHRTKTFKLSTDPLLLTSSVTLWGYIEPRSNAPSFYALMRNLRYKRLTAPSQCRRCGQAKLRGVPTIINAMEPHRCLQHLILQQEP